MKAWSFSKIWNSSLDSIEQRDYVPRDYIWASELGKCRYDRYWKMQGRQPSTPPNLRSRRKFEAGNLLEWTVKQVLVRAGVYQSSQDHIVNEDYGMRVTGRIDFLAGGEIKDVDMSDLPENFAAIATNVVSKLREMYPDGLRQQILEIKSSSAVMFTKYEVAPDEHHVLQAFHYAHNTQLPALIVYICKDDLRIAEYPILPNEPKYRDAYKADILAMKEVYDAKSPTLEPLLLYRDGKFYKNYMVEYSAYLDDYKFERPDEYGTQASSIARRINNVLKRKREGKQMTAKNTEAIRDTILFYPPADDIIKEEFADE